MLFVAEDRSKQVVSGEVVISTHQNGRKRTAPRAVEWQVSRIDYDFFAIILHYRSSGWPLAQCLSGIDCGSAPDS